MKFESTFWDTSKNYIYLFQDIKERQFPLWKNAGKNILWGFVCAEEALRVENLDPELLKDEIEQQMKTVYGKDQTECSFRPIDIYVTKWASDPNTVGAFSFYQAKAFSESKFEDLLKPVENLYFAGEAYNYKYSAFTHGAYLSGEKTAKDIIEKS